VRRSDAPPPGWYPDPEGGARLRWWEGTDWTDDYRAPPSSAAQAIAARRAAQTPRARSVPEVPTAAAGTTRISREDAEDIISQVRHAARSEVDRAADIFSQRARAATREIQPLVTEYTNRFFGWLRIIAVLVVVVVIAWFVFQAIAQQSLFEWIGDRIDNLTD
jgi:hypothetical protein